MAIRYLNTGQLALLVGLLPVVAINLSYVIAAAAGTVPACIPYIDGCTSISATGRQPPASWLFKPALYASALAMGVFWLRAGHWLKSLGEPSRRYRLALLWVGVIGALALVVYVYNLGIAGDMYKLMRRYGINVYFGFTFLAQLLLANRLYRLAESAGNMTLLVFARAMIGLCLLLLIIGLYSIPARYFIADHTVMERVLEWNFALLMHGWFFLAWLGWKK
jgi:hypothetical protein